MRLLFGPDRTVGHDQPDCLRIDTSVIASTRPVSASFLVIVALLFIAGCGRPASDPAHAPDDVIARGVARDTGTAAAHSLSERLEAGVQTVLELPLSAETLASHLAFDSGGISAVRFDDNSVVLKGSGQQLLVFLEDDGTSLQAVLPYFGPLPGELEAVAAWNAGRRFGRAYLDDEGAPILASDLLLVEGMPAAAVRTWGRLLIGMAEAFRAEVWPDSAQLTAPPSAR